MQDDDEEDDANIGKDSSFAGTDDAADNQGDSKRRNGWRVVRCNGCKFRQERPESNAQTNGQDNNLNNAEKHADRIKGDALSNEKVRNERRQYWRKQGRYTRHGDGKG